MRKLFFSVLFAVIAVVAIYGLGRLYYRLTDGFTVGNMTATFPYHPEWETKPLKKEAQLVLIEALKQPYTYLAKGCQAYVFQSQDDKYVIKFFKYQRFRLKPWEEYLPPLPFIESYRKEKLHKKHEKLERFLGSWIVAFNHLKRETGLVYVHLNTTSHLNTKLPITDKVGMHHTIDLDQYQFCIQRKADMFSDILRQLKAEHKTKEAELLVSRLHNLFLHDYARGFNDNDPALMQNTGVVDGYPVHIDIGQLVHDERMKDPDFSYPLFMLKMGELHQSNE